MKNILGLLIILFLACAQDISASKAIVKKMTVTLKDGSKRIVSLRGDEHFSYFASHLGELVIREGNTWRLASKKEQDMARQRLNAVVEKRKAMFKTGEQIRANHPFPSVGAPKALVLMVGFSDCDFVYTKTEIEALFNSTEVDPSSGFHSYSSLAQYMDECSGGKFRPQFDVAGPYKLDNTVEFYGQNTHGTDSNYAQFIRDACAKADADIDFSKYDADNDGYIDLVYIIYAGYGENYGMNPEYCLWPKSGTGNFGSYDGVQVYRFAINNELAGDSSITGQDQKPLKNGIGVLTHEFCHTMGMFDIYPTSNWSDLTWYDNQSMETWSLMDYGENNYNGYYPTPLTAWERELLGWIKIDTLKNPSDVVLEPLQYGGKAYKIINDNSPDKNEYYVLESIPNGQGTGFYGRMRGNGMLVTHVNYDSNYFSNFSSPNNKHGEPRLTILPADGILMTSYRLSLDPEDPLYIDSKQFYADHAGDTYPGTSAVTSITDYKPYYGVMDKPITDITQEGWTVRFKFMGGAPVDGIESVNGETPDSNAPAYNLAGQRVGNNYKGITIKNGRKIWKQ